MTIFASKLKQRAQELGISNAEAARRIGLGERRYANYISGSREPDLATLVKIAEVLGTSPNALLGLDEGKDGEAPSPAHTRLVAALNVLDHTTLEIVAVQVEALAKRATKS